MAHPLRHAESSARKFGGKPEDYLAIHNWFDESKARRTSDIVRFIITATARSWQRESSGSQSETRMAWKCPSATSPSSTSRKTWVNPDSPGLAGRNQSATLDVRSEEGQR
jgi:hypothetical protein